MGPAQLSATDIAAANRHLEGAGPYEVLRWAVDTGARHGLGVALLLQNRPAEALPSLEEAARGGNEARLWRDYGVALDLLGRNAEAQAAYRSGLGLNPADADLHGNLALSAAVGGDAGTAAAEARAAANSPRSGPRHRANAVLALADSPSRLRGIGHLRGHETDRLAAIAGDLGALGGAVAETDDGLAITPQPLHGAQWAAFADHRMAQAGAVLGLVADGVVVDDIACTTKTMSDFPQRWAALVGQDAIAVRPRILDLRHVARPERPRRAGRGRDVASDEIVRRTPVGELRAVDPGPVELKDLRTNSEISIKRSS